MKTENNKNWMIWAIVVLAVLNISTLGTILYHQYKSNRPVANSTQRQSQLETDAEKFSGRYFRDKLNLNEKQMDIFRETNRVFRQQARDITIELSELRKEMLIEMASAKTDTNKLNILSESIGSEHSRLKKLTFKYYLDIKSISNSEQQKQLEQLFGEMFTNDASMGFPGRNGPGGQRGKRKGTYIK